MEQQLKHRLSAGTLSVLIVSVVISLSHHPLFFPFFIVAISSAIGLTLLEYYQLCENKGYHPLQFLGLLCSVIYVAQTALVISFPLFSPLSDLLLFLFLGVFFISSFKSREQSIANLATTVFGIIYITIPLTTLININYHGGTNGHGSLWLAYAIVVTKATDLGGYFIGKSFGKTRLAPELSPKKTVEGFAGGLLLSLATSLFFYFYLFAPLGLMTLSQSIGLGVLISILAQLGDLAESLLKRDACVKDSSHIPGLGGMLDIMDSLIFTLPLTYLLLKMDLLG